MKALFALMLLLIPGIAAAQQLDQRLSTPAIGMLQAQVAFVEAKLKIVQDDNAAAVLRLCEAIPEDRKAAIPECRPENVVVKK